MTDVDDSKKAPEDWLERHAQELGLPAVPERLNKMAEQYPAYTLNYIRWRDSVIMTDGALSKKQKLLIALGAVTPTLSKQPWPRIHGLGTATLDANGPMDDA
jgi:alkylhydroperoxidase/carboxymuconolactone decarboxylase family protein YurZ